MDYIKWNCYDMAEGREALENCRRELAETCESLRDTSRRLDADISANGIGDSLEQALSEIEGVIAKLGAERSALDHAIDIYYSAETLANEQSESLPTKIFALNARVQAAAVNTILAGGAGTRETVGQTVIMEDWLAALVYWQNKTAAEPKNMEG